MRVLITGGTGFLGANLALAYARAGHQVVAVGKELTEAERENAADLRQAGVSVVVGDVTDTALMSQHCRGAAVVHHIAAAMREANIADSVFWEVNVEATRRLLDSARQAGVGRFVYCSSIGALGKTPQKPADETSPCEPEDIYQVTKRAAEELCLQYWREHGFPISIVRPADVYGPRDRRLLKLFKGVRSGKFAMIGGGNNEHHMVYVDDMVQGFLRAAEVEAAVGEIFIIAGEAPVTINRLVAVVAAAQGVAPPRLRVPLWPVQAAAVVVERLCRSLGVQPPIYPRRVDFFRTDFAFDIGKARRTLGYRPQYPLERGVLSTLRWYEQRGLIGAAGARALAREGA